jgi:hypothetical protein
MSAASNQNFLNPFNTRFFGSIYLNGTRSITGSIFRTNLQTVAPDTRVVLFDRATLRAVASTRSSSNGSFSLGSNFSSYDNYYLIAFDDVGTNNSIIVDKVVPI